MNLDWTAELIDQLESHWHSRLRPRLDGLTDEEYFWQPVPGCLSLSRRAGDPAPSSGGAGGFVMDSGDGSDGRPPVTTIGWRIAHLIDNFGAPDAPHFSGLAADRLTVDYSGTAEGALRQLDEAHDAWVDDVRGLGPEELAGPQGTLSPPAFAREPMAKLVLYTNMEIIHHGAEVCLLRDLLRWKGVDKGLETVNQGTNWQLRRSMSSG